MTERRHHLPGVAALAICNVRMLLNRYLRCGEMPVQATAHLRIIRQPRRGVVQITPQIVGTLWRKRLTCEQVEAVAACNVFPNARDSKRLSALDTAGALAAVADVALAPGSVDAGVRKLCPFAQLMRPEASEHLRLGLRREWQQVTDWHLRHHRSQPTH